MPGDELRLRYSGDAAHSAWQSVGHVVCTTFILSQLLIKRAPLAVFNLHFLPPSASDNTLSCLIYNKKLLEEMVDICNEQLLLNNETQSSSLSIHALCLFSCCI